MYDASYDTGIDMFRVKRNIKNEYGTETIGSRPVLFYVSSSDTFIGHCPVSIQSERLP